MNYAVIKCSDVANGPGVRVSLFVSGCTHHCKGCFNSEAWDFSFGKPFNEETEAHILKLLERPYIRGLSVLGGEPFEPDNQLVLAGFLKKVKERYPQKTIWCYTGYDYEKDITGKMKQTLSQTSVMLENIDILVDGKFIEAQKNLNLRFRGSSNQRIIDIKKSVNEKKIVLWNDNIK
ncbi:MAG: anaerobic ribonucleoside-triphosphate reductase activating protein [Oscillospiraceae bacterium]|nr:anaerobic ribonucleoside-triphosphate reductase activating protein [Oscillospiraceae bacterium]